MRLPLILGLGFLFILSPACRDELDLSCNHPLGRFTLNDSELELLSTTATLQLVFDNTFNINVKNFTLRLHRADGTHIALVLYNWEEDNEVDCLESKSYFDDPSFNQCIHSPSEMICEGAWLSYVRNADEAFSSQANSNGKVIINFCDEGPRKISLEVHDFVMSNPATGETLLLTGCIHDLAFEVIR